jgi:hypothetical protein
MTQTKEDNREAFNSTHVFTGYILLTPEEKRNRK